MSSIRRSPPTSPSEASSPNSLRANICAPSCPWFARLSKTPARPTTSIDAIAVTQGPGLAGALLVGLSYAKTLAFAADKPLIAVNHLEGHIHAVLLEERQNGNNDLQFPVLALVVSGGHTHLYLAERHDSGWTYRNIGHTRDDAAGEAFDKVAKLLELGYPGGPVIDFLAQHGNPLAVKFPFAQIKHRDRNPQNRHAADERRTDFSYSGIKTAVLRYVEVHNLARKHSAPPRRDEGHRQANARGLPRRLRLARPSISSLHSSAPWWTISSARRWRPRSSTASQPYSSPVESPPTASCARPSMIAPQKKASPCSSLRASSPPTTPP